MRRLRKLALLVCCLLCGCAKSEEVVPSGKKSYGGAVGIGGAESFPSGGQSQSGGASGAGACTTGEQRSCYPGDPGEIDVGICAEGTETCANGVWGDCTGAVTPASEVCEGSDDENCNGEVDEDCCATESYEKETGLVSGNGTVCCDGNDQLVSASDCGVGDNHTHGTSGNCGTASEGAANNGSACVRITCEKTVCANP